MILEQLSRGKIRASREVISPLPATLIDLTLVPLNAGLRTFTFWERNYNGIISGVVLGVMAGAVAASPDNHAYLMAAELVFIGQSAAVTNIVAMRDRQMRRYQAYIESQTSTQ